MLSLAWTAATESTALSFSATTLPRGTRDASDESDLRLSLESVIVSSERMSSSLRFSAFSAAEEDESRVGAVGGAAAAEFTAAIAAAAAAVATAAGAVAAVGDGVGDGLSDLPSREPTKPRKEGCRARACRSSSDLLGT